MFLGSYNFSFIICFLLTLSLSLSFSDTSVEWKNGNKDTFFFGCCEDVFCIGELHKTPHFGAILSHCTTFKYLLACAPARCAGSLESSHDVEDIFHGEKNVDIGLFKICIGTKIPESSSLACACGFTTEYTYIEDLLS